MKKSLLFLSFTLCVCLIASSVFAASNDEIKALLKNKNSKALTFNPPSDEHNLVTLLSNTKHFYCIISSKKAEIIKELCRNNGAEYKEVRTFKDLILWKRIGVIITLNSGVNEQNKNFVKTLISDYYASPFENISFALRILPITTMGRDPEVHHKLKIEAQKGLDLMNEIIAVPHGENCTVLKGILKNFPGILNNYKYFKCPMVQLCVESIDTLTNVKRTIYSNMLYYDTECPLCLITDLSNNNGSNNNELPTEVTFNIVNNIVDITKFLKNTQHFYCIISPKNVKKLEELCKKNDAKFEIMESFREMIIWKRIGVLVTLNVKGVNDKNKEFVETLIESYEGAPFEEISFYVRIIPVDKSTLIREPEVKKEITLEAQKGLDLMNEITAVPHGENSTVLKGILKNFPDLLKDYKEFYDPVVHINVECIDRLTCTNSRLFLEYYYYNVRCLISDLAK